MVLKELCEVSLFGELLDHIPRILVKIDSKNLGNVGIHCQRHHPSFILEFLHAARGMAWGAKANMAHLDQAARDHIV